MPSPIAKERSDLPSPKRKKVEETTYDDDSSDPSDSDEDSTDEDLQLFNQEMRKSGGYEIDLSKLRYTFGWESLDLDQISLIDGQEESNRDFIAMLMLLKHAFTKHANETGTSLELVKILRVNFHLSAGATYYISFEVKDPSDGNQTKPYRAKVRYLPRDIEVYSCCPKPSS